MYKSEVTEQQATARVVAYSVSAFTGEEIITFELEYPRLVHSELLTHRLFSRNAASSRAIPVKTLIAMVVENPAMPVRFGANQPGMQDKGVDHDTPVVVAYGGMGTDITLSPREAWRYAAGQAAKIAGAFADAGYHKQVCNRVLEPYQFIKVVLTFTGRGENFFGLREHDDADPTIHDLAVAMRKAREAATATLLGAGDWHLPYYKDGAFIKKRDRGLQQAIRVSASCSAQVSYRKLDNSEEKADLVYDRLVNSKPVHASPFEHQATPLKRNAGFRNPAVTHMDREGNYWSGNLRNWAQHRQMIPGNVIV